MRQAWGKLARRFDALKPRERVMVFAAGVAIIAGLGFVLAIDGALAKHKILAANAEKHRIDLAQLQKQNAEMSRLLNQDADAEGRKRIDDLRRQLGSYDTELRSVQQGLVPPNRMVRVLEDMLSRDSHVRLVKLRTLPVAALMEPAGAHADNAAAKSAAPSKNLVYKHGIELTVEGNYLDLLEYQARLEKLPWRMFFARTSVNAVDYPRVLMTITLYTLSLEEAWLVV
ncbi:MAG: type II secretion system protein M [Betaproteobacteria bacterium]|nr:type II secretion system protein M [Betaproteobacteria bacterium]